MTTDGQTAKTKVVDVKKLWNCVVDNFFIWNHLIMKNYIWIYQILNSNFVNNLDRETNKMKVIDLEKL
jgi:hypothetical protein